ncbi:MAG: hypothetical protein AAFR96_02305 [Planctomycetota bacterium]
MADQPPLCVRCGYPARQLESSCCPECGAGLRPTPRSPLAEAARSVIDARRAALGLLWRDGKTHRRLAFNIVLASALLASAVVWTWLLDPVRGALREPLSAITTVFHLVFVVSLALCCVGSLVVAFEHTVIALIARILHVGRAGVIAARVSSISSFGLVVGGLLAFLLVAGLQMTGSDGLIAGVLPAGGFAAGVVSWVRSTAAGLWAAGLLRDAGW